MPSLDLKTVYPYHQWQLRHTDGRELAVRHTPRLVTDDMWALRQAALAGLGIVQLPLLAVHEALAAGTLERVLPAWAPPTGVVHAVFASRRGMLPAVRQLVDFLARGYRARNLN